MNRVLLFYLIFIVFLCVTVFNCSRGFTSNYSYVSQSQTNNENVKHIYQKDIEYGKWTINELKLAGKNLFITQFMKGKGAGRPGATGNPNPTRRPLGTSIDFVRTAGPDSNSCLSCHRSPSIGGAGDFTVNVFTGIGTRQPISFSISPELSAERGTPDLNGSGLIELLAREMTDDLHMIKNSLRNEAILNHKIIRKELLTKGISFGFITSDEDGTLRLNEVQGVDRDLVIRPWGQKGTVTSLRTFTVNAENLHHGLQAEERFGYHLTGSFDFDRDNINDELTEGDITALVVFQASLNTPGTVIPSDKKLVDKITKGKHLFNQSLCISCHKPKLELKSTVFREPSQYNLEGTLRIKDVTNQLAIDLSKDADKPNIKEENGKFYVRAFTDLKRHVISDDEKPHFGNEVIVEGLSSIDEFITKRLWSVGNTGPYGHRGDLTSIREAIENHGGEAKESRIEFEEMTLNEQESIIEYLRTLQILPPNTKKNKIYAQKTKKLPYIDE